MYRKFRMCLRQAAHSVACAARMWLAAALALLVVPVIALAAAPSALALVSQGAIQNFKPYDTVTLVEPQTVTAPGADGKPVTTTVTTQTIAQGPLASQEADRKSTRLNS